MDSSYYAHYISPAEKSFNRHSKNCFISHEFLGSGVSSVVLCTQFAVYIKWRKSGHTDRHFMYTANCVHKMAVSVAGFAAKRDITDRNQDVTTRCWTNAGLMLAHCPRRWLTLNQHWFNVSCLLGWVVTANTRHWANVGSMLDQRRRRWTNINTTVAQCLVPYYTRRCFNVGPPSRTLDQHQNNNGWTSQKWMFKVTDLGGVILTLTCWTLTQGQLIPPWNNKQHTYRSGNVLYYYEKTHII